MKKLMALMTALALMLCSGAALAEAEYPPAITDEDVTLKVTRYIRDIDNIDVNGLWYNEHLEELTGVHVDYTAISQSDFATQLNLMFASGEYPDILIDCGNLVDMEMYAVDQGVFMALDDLINEHMPNYKALMEKNDLTYKSTVASDGNIYAIGYIADSGEHISNGYNFINGKWLEELNLSMPTTLDEFYNVLVEFKKAHPDSYIWEGEFAEIWTALSPMWGITENSKWFSIYDDGVVRFNATVDGYRAMLEFAAKLYAEELMDPAIITQDSNTKIAKFNENNTGFALLWRTRSMGWDCFVDQMVRMPYFAADGYETKIRENIALANKQVWLPYTCSNPEIAAKWVDYQLTPQLAFEGFYGPEGTLWNWNAEGKCELGPAGDQECVKWAYGVNTICYMPGNVYNDHFQQPDYRLERINYAKEADVAGHTEKYPQGYVSGLANLNAEESQEIALLFASIDTLMKESIADFVSHGVTDDGWNAFQQRLIDAGIERYVEIYQGVFDRYMATQQ